jgi:hypothetical protein
VRNLFLVWSVAPGACDTHAYKDIADSGIVIGDAPLLEYLGKAGEVNPRVGFGHF